MNTTKTQKKVTIITEIFEFLSTRNQLLFGICLTIIRKINFTFIDRIYCHRYRTTILTLILIGDDRPITCFVDFVAVGFFVDLNVLCSHFDTLLSDRRFRHLIVDHLGDSDRRTHGSTVRIGPNLSHTRSPTRRNCSVKYPKYKNRSQNQ